MAVYKKTYRPYNGDLTSSVSRLFVIPRFAFEDLQKSRFLTIFFLTTFIYPLIAALFMFALAETLLAAWFSRGPEGVGRSRAGASMSGPEVPQP